MVDLDDAYDEPAEDLDGESVEDRYDEPEWDENYGMSYRHNRIDDVYEWEDPRYPGVWMTQEDADSLMTEWAQADGDNADDAAQAAAETVPLWDENFRMFYRPGADGAYEYAHALKPGVPASGAGEVWLSYEQIMQEHEAAQVAVSADKGAQGEAGAQWLEDFGMFYRRGDGVDLYALPMLPGDPASGPGEWLIYNEATGQYETAQPVPAVAASQVEASAADELGQSAEAMAAVAAQVAEVFVGPVLDQLEHLAAEIGANRAAEIVNEILATTLTATASE